MTQMSVADPYLEYVYEIGAGAILNRENGACIAFLDTIVDREPRYLTLLWRLADFACNQRNYCAAQLIFERAVAIDPQHPESQIGLAIVHEELGDLAGAQALWSSDLLHGAIRVFPYTGTARPVRVLTIASALHSIRYELFVDPALMLNMTLYTQAYAPGAPLPEHDVVLIAVADVESDSRALEIAHDIVARTRAPVINHPNRVFRTGRREQARRLAALDDVVTANVAMAPRERLLRDDAGAYVRSLGFTFPLLVRSPGFHNGRFFERVDEEEAMPGIVAELPGSEVMLIAYQDTRSPDGVMRKYRVMSIGGRLYPLHLAISPHWKVHYATSAMHDRYAYREEERAFLSDMPRAIGSRTVRALEAIAQTMQLDYAGIDFAIDAIGRVVVFEANGAMAIFTPESDARWDYRRAAVSRALNAVKAMIVERSSPAS